MHSNIKRSLKTADRLQASQPLREQARSYANNQRRNQPAGEMGTTDQRRSQPAGEMGINDHRRSRPAGELNHRRSRPAGETSEHLPLSEGLNTMPFHQPWPRLLHTIKTAVISAWLVFPLLANAMTPINNSELSDITGQALLTSDYIAPNSLGVTDPNSALQGGTMPIGFYRMGLDATVATNVNINKLQLGCGGFNNNIKVGCDIDLDYISMMGLGNGSNQPNQTSAYGGTVKNTDAGAPVTSDFLMTRPFVSIAVAYPNDPTKREVVGFEFGAQSVTGYMGIGRVYQNGQVNQETGETCVATYSNSVGCHSGINSLSGFMHATISGAVTVDDDTGIVGIHATGDACFGNTTYGSRCNPGKTAYGGPGGAKPAGPPNYPELTADIIGTRINSLSTVMVSHANAKALGGLIDLDLDLPTVLNENLRFIHGFSVNNTSNFFLSFQRQQVAWPTYDKSGYAALANAGWWMNIPQVNSTDIQGAQVNVTGIPTDMTLNNVELLTVPPVNCYGGYRYC